MHSVEIKRDWMIRARDRAILTPTDREKIADFLRPQTSVYTFDVVLGDWPKELWRALLDDARLPPKVRAAVALHVFGMQHGEMDLEAIYTTIVRSPVEFGTTFQMAVGRNPNCEMLVNGRWYPVILTVKFVEDDQKWTRAVELSCSLRLGERTFGMSFYASRELFLSDSSEPVDKTVLDVLQFLVSADFKRRSAISICGSLNPSARRRNTDVL